MSPPTTAKTHHLHYSVVGLTRIQVDGSTAVREPTSDVQVEAVGGDVVAQVGGRALVPAGVLHGDGVEQDGAVSHTHPRRRVICERRVEEKLLSDARLLKFVFTFKPLGLTETYTTDIGIPTSTGLAFSVIDNSALKQDASMLSCVLSSVCFAS